MSFFNLPETYTDFNKTRLLIARFCMSETVSFSDLQLAQVENQIYEEFKEALN